ncbi:uncharacterized protein LOC122863060 isoform X2 [Siniperca chuatsi]|uniref:uncharacterized protein LOC122863060 isoform X2 n=1 Tax=Siniperca chuatsi TaxID=119488 RepID=UPI001CE05D1B|nr:uncharacterized protein LOC122863060 isoform X2 [Siniperca chuatsi]
MAEFKWISLFLIAVLQFTAAEKRPLLFTVRVGDEVTLPCDNVTDGERKCDGTEWLFFGSGNTAAVDLIYLGQIGERAKAKADRLSVTASCSLVIKKVTVKDVGYYYCLQLRSEQQQGEGSEVLLSVVTMTEHEDPDKVTLNCSVLTYERCKHTAKWLYEGEDVAKDNKDLVTSQSLCRASVSFLTSHYIHTSRSNFLTCEVTVGNKVHLFPFRLRPSGEKPGEDTTTATTESTTTTENSRKAGITTTASAINDASTELQGDKQTATTKSTRTTTTAISDASTELQLNWWRFSIVSAGLAALIIIAVAVNMWTRTKGKKTQMDENKVNDDEDEGVVNYENFGDPSASVRLR